ncbi:MAG TPA: sialidase family protein [Thermoanaerobaculia bacterium]|nr:sialidase family protein [Thermoanaerobaculia bacterium]
MLRVRFPSRCIALAVFLPGFLLITEAGFSQKPARKVEAPSRLTVIKPAPPEMCRLLDDPEQRTLMDGLLFNLLWSCGRQDELGSVAGESGMEEAREKLDLITAAASTTDARPNNPAGEVGATSTQSETSITRNPLTGTLCSAFNDSGEFFGGGGGLTGFARSTDGGQTWQDNGAVGGISLGDPSLVWRRADGSFYLATLAAGGSIALWVSTNDCQTFSHLSAPSASGGDDKEMLAVDNNPLSPHYGNLYLAWKDFSQTGAPIRATRSTDGGVTWSAPVTVATGGATQGAWPAVAPNGHVFIAWIEFLPDNTITIHVARSTTGGSFYNPRTSPLVNGVRPRDATATANCGRTALRGNIRYFALPQITVDGKGVLHAVYSYDPDGFNTGDVIDVFHRRSINGGATWSPEFRLNDDKTTSDQYFPTIQSDGSKVMATWYDRRLDPGNLLQDYYKRISTDSGLTWEASERVSDESSPVVLNPELAACYHGDYDQSYVSVSGEAVQWSDDRDGDPDAWVDAVGLTPAVQENPITSLTATSSCQSLGADWN